MEKISTSKQIEVPFGEILRSQNIFRPIHYLGSKLRLLDFIEETLNSIDSTKGRVCDLFAGSGSVSFKLGYSRSVTSIDIQEYSRVICSSLLNPISDFQYAKYFMDELRNNEHTKLLLWCIDPLAKHELFCIDKALTGYPEYLCDLLENGSILTHELKSSKGSLDLIKAMKETLKRIKKANLTNIEVLTIRHFGGLYFSYYQSAQIDIILNQISKLDPNYKDCFLASLLSTLSDTVNTVGKQFAQPIRPREINGTPKGNIGKQTQKDRSINIFTEYENWLLKYMKIQLNKGGHEVHKLDYSEALDMLPLDTSIIYADPPYTRDHYSRFYHTLETICLRDDPQVSTMVLNGADYISRGIYRDKRHQSPFCIKSQAPKAFETLFAKASNANCSLVLSYSPFDESKKVHPRLLTMKDLIQIGKKFYKKIEIISPGKFSHSKLTNSKKHLESSSNAEVLIVCQK